MSIAALFQLVHVEGRLTTRECEARSGGGKRYRTEIVTGPLPGHEKPLGLETGMELRVCKPLGLGASLNQYSKRNSG